VLRRLVDALPDARRFYDVNLRPGSDSRELTCDLLRWADVVKLNERELIQVRGWLGLPADLEGFCRVGAERFGWQAACVTLGARGCAMLVGDDFAEAAVVPVAAADTVGAGDAFAAAFLHGLIAGWPVPTVAECANRAGAEVVSARGAASDR
jgi:fructokinase